MANKKHLALIQDLDSLLEWKQEHPHESLDLSNADFRGIYHLKGADLSGADLRRARLSKADLTWANLSKVDLSEARFTLTNLSEANLSEANLSNASFDGARLIRANLTKANLTGVSLTDTNLSDANLTGAELSGIHNLNGAILKGVNLSGVNLSGADLTGADLTGADLSGATLISTNLRSANLTNCQVYGISAWDVQLENAKQLSLIITPPNQPTITVDDLKIAHFIYTLLNNKNTRDVLDNITRKVVLILGRFTDERKKVLDAIRDELRKWNYLPVVFDFEKPANRDLTETVSTLAHLARFVIADITDAKSIPQELEVIVPNLPSVPVQPLLQMTAKEYSMAEHFWRYPWVLKIYRYPDVDDLLESIQKCIIEPAEQKAKELAPKSN